MSLCGAFSMLISEAREIIKEFEKIPNKKNILGSFPWIETVYMRCIIVELNKILSGSKNDVFSLSKFKTGFDEKIESDIIKIENDNKTLIEKIKNNRNQLFAHLDKGYLYMKLSKSAVMSLEKKFETDFSSIESKCKVEERYTPPDLRNDLKNIKKLLDECSLIQKSVFASYRR